MQTRRLATDPKAPAPAAPPADAQKKLAGLRKVLGLPDDATPEDVLAAVQALVTPIAKQRRAALARMTAREIRIARDAGCTPENYVYQRDRMRANSPSGVRR